MRSSLLISAVLLARAINPEYGDPLFSTPIVILVMFFVFLDIVEVMRK